MASRELRIRLGTAIGSPSTTAVIDRTHVRDGPPLDALVVAADRFVCDRHRGAVNKIALVRQASGPSLDVDYTFVQMSGTGTARVADPTGTCGHSALVAAAVASSAWGWADGSPGRSVRVGMGGRGDTLIATVRAADADGVTYTAGYMLAAEVEARSLLACGTPTVTLGSGERATLIAAGNHYLFVDGRDLGVRDAEDLFDQDDDMAARTQARLETLRAEAARRLKLPASPNFPKAAVVLATGDGDLAVRALHCDAWHPSLALTGLIALATAAVVDGSVVRRCVDDLGLDPSGMLPVRTPGGRVTARALCGRDRDGRMTVRGVSVPDKRVSFAPYREPLPPSCSTSAVTPPGTPFRPSAAGRLAVTA